jgi:hypothetical protein
VAPEAPHPGDERGGGVLKGKEMEDIKEYAVIKCYDLVELAEQVNRHIGFGWRPYGSPVVTNAPYIDRDGVTQNDFTFFQAVVK